MTIKIELEFIPVSERLPDESGDYVCFHNLDRHNSVRIVTYCYSAKHKAFNVKDRYDSYDAKNCSLNYLIKAWAALPDLSKAKEEKPMDLEACRKRYNEATNDYFQAICFTKEVVNKEKPNFHTVNSVSTKEYENEMEAFAKSYKYRTKSIQSEPVDTTKEILEEIEADQENMRRRRDLFERVALIVIQSRDLDGLLTEEVAEDILKAADKFARGEL